MMFRYMNVMMKNKELIELGYQKQIAFDPMSVFDEDKKEMISKIYQLNEKNAVKDEVFENAKEVLLNTISEKRIGDERITNAENHVNEDESNEMNEHIRSFDELSAVLDSLVGLQDVKNQVQSMFNLVHIRQLCRERGIERQPMSYHMVFTGNPGTGKTTIARLIAEIYHSIGLLSKGHLVEVSRADLVAGYIGHTAQKVQEIIQTAKGGVLFIDEAYALVSHSGNDFGHEAIETLIKEMEDNRDDLIVIVAGYPALMQELLESNPGLSSRFTKTIHFADYNVTELTQIFGKFCCDNGARTSKKVMDIVRRYFEVEVAQKTKNFGNARMVRNYFEQVMMNQANRLALKDSISDAMLCNITIEDIPQKIVIDKRSLFKV